MRGTAVRLTAGCAARKRGAAWASEQRAWEKRRCHQGATWTRWVCQEHCWSLSGEGSTQSRVVPSRRTASPGAPPLRFLGPRMVASAAAQKLKPRSSTCCGWISNVGTTVSIGDQGLKLAALLSSWHGGAAASWPASHGGIEGRPILCELMAVGRSSGPVHKGTRPGTASAGNAVRSSERFLAALLSGCNRPPPPEVDSTDDYGLYRCNYRAYGVKHVLCSLSTPEGLLSCTALTLDSLSATIRLAIGACDGLGRQAGGRAFVSP